MLSNNAAGLSIGEAQYTIIQSETGGAIDDAYLYRFDVDEWILVVNAANREKDWNHFQNHIGSFTDISLLDKTDKSARAIPGAVHRNRKGHSLEAGGYR